MNPGHLTRSWWFRATVASSLALAVALTVVVFTVHRVTLLGDRTALDDTLTLEGDAVATAVVAELAGADPDIDDETLHRSLVRVLSLHPGSTKHLTVVRHGEREVSTARGPARLETLRDESALPDVPRSRLTTVEGLRARSLEVLFGDRSIDVVTFGDFAALAQNARTVAWRATIAALIGGSVGLAALAVVLHRSTRGLSAVSATVRRTRLDDLRARVPEPSGSNEVADLARDVNAMLDQLVKARRARDELIASVSHELRTPLAAARGHMELLAQGRAADPTSSLARIESELGRLTRLVDDLLALARAGDPSWLAVQLVPVRHVLDALGDRLRGLGLSDVTVDAAPDVRLEVDPDRLLQALSNLVVNAATHTPEGTRIGVGVALEAQHVVFTVNDDGPGIPADVLDRIGERFVRGSADGTGLGLAVTRAVAVAHGGDLEIASDASGTSARLRLPLDGDPPAEAMATSRP